MTSTETSTTELAAFKDKVRSTADEYRRAGYADLPHWNALLVHLGLEPFPARQAKLKLPVDTVLEKAIDAGSRDDQWWQANKASMVTAADLVQDLDLDGLQVEIVQTTPGTEGEEKLPGADTEDLAQYKRLVRREGLKLKREYGWCESGVNDVFRTVGLTPTGTVVLPIDVVIQQRIRLQTDAIDVEEAAAMLAAGELDDLVKAQFTVRTKALSWGPADPHLRYVGDPDPTGYEGGRSNNRGRAHNLGLCAAEDPRTGYVCTWADANHEDNHVAASYGEIIATWPKQA